MSRAKQGIVGQVRELVASLSVLPEADKVSQLNMIRRCLHQASPFRDEPIDLVEWVPRQAVGAGVRAIGNPARGYVPTIKEPTNGR